MLQKRKKIIKYMYFSLTFFIVLIISIIFISNKYKKERTYIDDTKVMDTLSQVLDLSTVKYNYSNIVEIKKDKSINDIKIPFTEKTFIIKYNGVINGGINIDDIEIISNRGDKIFIKINKCQILDHYIDDENIYIYDIKTSIFNKLDVQEILDDVSNSKKEYEEKVINEGFMDEVKNNTKVSIEKILNGLGYKEVTIEFKL